MSDYEDVEDAAASATDARDPLQAQDPWNRPSAPQPPAEPPRRQTMAGAQHSSGEAPPMRIIHDIPPVWDGNQPEKQLEPYMKLLRGWLATTRTLKTQAGMTILNFATGDLKLIINELEIDDLTADDSGQVVYKHITASYAEFIEKKLPQAIEA